MSVKLLLVCSFHKIFKFTVKKMVFFLLDFLNNRSINTFKCELSKYVFYLKVNTKMPVCKLWEKNSLPEPKQRTNDIQYKLRMAI